MIVKFHILHSWFVNQSAPYSNDVSFHLYVFSQQTSDYRTLFSRLSRGTHLKLWQDKQQQYFNILMFQYLLLISCFEIFPKVCQTFKVCQTLNVCQTLKIWMLTQLFSCYSFEEQPCHYGWEYRVVKIQKGWFQYNAKRDLRMRQEERPFIAITPMSTLSLSICNC